MVILFPSVGREFYSTLFVFLTDTFTGKCQSIFWKMTFFDRIFFICAIVIQQDR